MTGLVDAVGFLTRVPVGRRHSGGSDLASAVPWFPVVGALVGLAQAGVYVAAGEVLPPLAAASLAVTAQIVLTGAFHEDGLADAADATGGWTRDERLRIMADPVHGTYGVLALVASFALRVAALSALDGWGATAALPAAHALGRGAAVVLMGWLRPASGSGLGAAYVTGLTRRQTTVALVAAAAVAAAGLRDWAPFAAALAVAAALGVGHWARRKLGGLTGDVLGATEQVTEVVVLLLAAASAG